MVKESVKTIIKKQPIARELAWLLKETRISKNFTQDELARSFGMTRQAYGMIESGGSQRLDVVRVSEIINHCGEHLLLSTTLDHHPASSTFLEDEVLLAFGEGRLSDANRRLKELRYMAYPPGKIYGKCKRNLGIAISAYFNEQPSQSHQLMTDVVMGLSRIGCFEEADELRELYQRIIFEGEEALRRETTSSLGGVEEGAVQEDEAASLAGVGETIVVDQAAYTLCSVNVIKNPEVTKGMILEIVYIMDNRSKVILDVGRDVKVYGEDGQLVVAELSKNTGGTICSGKFDEMTRSFFLDKLGEIEICFRSQLNLAKTNKFIVDLREVCDLK